jgi:hypothetical protein
MTKKEYIENIEVIDYLSDLFSGTLDYSMYSIIEKYGNTPESLCFFMSKVENIIRRVSIEVVVNYIAKTKLDMSRNTEKPFISIYQEVHLN